MENPRLFLLKITAMISLAILIVNPFVSGALVQAQTTFESIDEGLYTNSRGIPTSEAVSGWRRVGPYLDTATNMTIQKYQLQVNYTGAQFSVLYERSNGTEQTYGNPISQEAVFINMHWLDTAGNLQSGYAIVGLPSIYNDTNGNGVFDRVYTKNETHVSNVSYPDKPIARKSEMNNPIPEFGAPTTTTNAQGIKETYFNITFPNAVSGDGIKKWKDYGGIVDDNAALLPGDTKWTITYGFHVMNDNSKLKVKFDLKIVLTDLSVPALGSGDFINIEVP